MFGGHPHNADSESLQTDVMRFMAIIAFCLIAILALVRNSEPVSRAEAVPAVAATEHAASPPPVPVTEPEPVQALEPLPRLPDDDPPDEPPRVEARAASQPGARPRTATEEAKQPASAATARNAPEPRALSLRFASHRDFMRLVARGDIQVYAFRNQDVLSLDRSFQFFESPAPPSVYSLEPQTIPELVTAALTVRRADTDGFAWGIRMPQRLESRIRALVDQGVTGQLVIDRYGEVLHVAGG